MLSLLYAALLLAPVPALAPRLGLFLLSFAGVATGGYLLNDWCDRGADARAGKSNPLSGTAPSLFALYAAACLSLGLLPWLWLPRTSTAFPLLLAEIALLILYPLARLKGRGWAGVLADSTYASVLPYAIAAGLFFPQPGTLLLATLLVLWTGIQGVRNILEHQLADAANDAAAGECTTAVRLGPARTRRIIRTILFPAEVAGFTALCLCLPAPLCYLPLFYALYVVYAYQRELRLLRNRGYLRPAGYNFISGVLLNEFYEKWLCYGLLALLCVQNISYAWLLLLHSILFYRQPLLFLSDARLVYGFIARRLQKALRPHA